jgi:hypothetical protein
MSALGGKRRARQKELPLKIPIAIALLACASAASAGSPLWQNIEAGMTPAQVQALYPAGEGKKDKWIVRNVEVAPKCKANVDIFYKDGRVIRVMLYGKREWFGSCGDTLHAALLAKYGEPVSKEDKATANQRNLKLAVDELIWSREGVLVRFNRDNSSNNVLPWTMEYDSTPQQIGL